MCLELLFGMAFWLTLPQPCGKWFILEGVGGWGSYRLFVMRVGASMFNMEQLKCSEKFSRDYFVDAYASDAWRLFLRIYRISG